MPLVMQSKLLRVLEEGEIERVGGDKPIAVDARVVVATHRNLEEMVRQGSFRADLFHRIYVFPIALPPLRERAEEIPALAEYFAAQVASQNGWRPKHFSPESLEILQRYAWPGNVRELRNVVERVLLLSSAETITAEEVNLALPAPRNGEPHILNGKRTADAAPGILRAGSAPRRAAPPSSPHDQHRARPGPGAQPPLQKVPATRDRSPIGTQDGVIRKTPRVSVGEALQ